MRITNATLVLAIAAGAPLLARSADVQVTSSTQNLFYQDFLSADRNQDDIAEYLRVNVTNLDPAGKASVHGYGRVLRQLATSDESRPEIATDTVGRLYYLYLDYRDVIPDLDLKVGRSFLSAAAAPGTVDGLYLNLKSLGPVGLTAFGGRRVILTNKSEVWVADNELAGGSLYFDAPRSTHAEVSYAVKYTQGEFAQEYVALDVSSTPFQTVNLVGRARYDAVSDRLNEVLGDLNLTPISNLTVKGEYYLSHPTFDRFSFYRFFNVNDYRQLSVAAEYRFTPDYRLNAKYANEHFDGDTTADLYVVGVFARPLPSLILNATYQVRTGFAGWLNGLKFSGSYRIAMATLLAGIDYDDFRSEDLSSRTGTAKKYWAGLNYEFSRIFGASARAEDNLNFYFSHAYQGLVALNVHL